MESFTETTEFKQLQKKIAEVEERLEFLEKKMGYLEARIIALETDNSDIYLKDRQYHSFNTGLD